MIMLCAASSHLLNWRGEYPGFCKRILPRFRSLLSILTLLFTLGYSATPASGQQTTINVDTPVSGGTYSGTKVFGGWAVDSGSEIATVIALVDGVTPGQSGGYGTNRQDVCNVYQDFPGCPNVGWNFAFDTSQLVDGWHYLRVIVTTVDGRTSSQDVTFYTNNPGASIVNIDAPVYSNSYSGTAVFGGWAVNSTATISAIKILIDGSPAGSAGIGNNRQDACNAVGNYPGCPNVGWTYDLDTTKLPNGNHQFTATAVTSDGRATSASILYFVTQNDQASLINIDTPGDLSRIWATDIIGGWAMDRNSPLSAVSLSIDGVPYGSATIENRQDACNAIGNWPGCPNVGWDYALDTEQLSEGTHELAVTAVMSNGKQIAGTRTFFVQNTPSIDAKSLDASATNTTSPPIACIAGGYNLSSHGVMGQPGSSDGLIHVTYSIDTTDSAVANPINAAIKAWRDMSAQTGVTFDPPAPGEPVNLPFNYNPGEADGKQRCAEHDPNTSRILYGDTWKSSNAKQAIMEHEIGHYLGLDDVYNNRPAVATIMNNSSTGEGWPMNCPRGLSQREHYRCDGWDLNTSI